MPSGRFIFLLFSIVLAACAGYSAMVLSSASWAEARALDAIFPFYKWRIQWFSATELAHTRQLLALLAMTLTGLATGLAANPRGQVQFNALITEIRATSSSMSRAFANLNVKQRKIATSAFTALTALRVWLSILTVTPGYDDVPSYEMFASKSLLAVSAYYPVPNNHVLSNTLSWVFYQVNPGFWFTMRLPVLLTATLATGLLFIGLLNARTGFKTALLAVMLFGLMQLSLYHAAVGRGYWLLTLAAGIVFFCTLALNEETTKPRAAWTGLVVSSLVGAYTVPTFALVLASAFSLLGLRQLRQRQWHKLAQLATGASTIILGTLLLYTPLLFISGPTSLFYNGFVAPLPMANFWTGLPLYLWETEGFLAGQMKVGAILTISTLVAAGLGLQRAKARTLPQSMLWAWQKLVPAALWFMLMPYAVLAAQRVFAPSRTLFYKSIFSFMILSITLDWLLANRPARQRQILSGLLAVILLFWTTYQIGSLTHENQTTHRRNAALHAAFNWLARRPPAPTLVPEPTHSLFINMYLHSELPDHHWQIHARPYPGCYYTYVLAFPNKHGQFQPRFTTLPVFRNEQVEIYQAAGVLPATYWYMIN